MPKFNLQVNKPKDNPEKPIVDLTIDTTPEEMMTGAQIGAVLVERAKALLSRYVRVRIRPR